ncbi:MAG: stage III sporulation protein AE [Eubacteriales bacterium]|nr:stage III sporulation protein AE [Eubacteriales bacterium]
MTKKMWRAESVVLLLAVSFFCLLFPSSATKAREVPSDGWEEEMAGEETAGDGWDAEILESGLDIDAVSKEIERLGEGEGYPKFSEIFQDILALRFKDAAKTALDWLLGSLGYEIRSSWLLVSELLGVVLFSAVFSNISSSFRNFSIGNSGFLVVYLLVFSIIFSNFTLMSQLFSKTVEMLSSLLKIVIPAFALSVTISGNISMGAVFYEYFMVIVLAVNWFCLVVILPMIQYYLLLELINNFSAGQTISRLCESLYWLLSRGMRLLFFLFFGFHLLEAMVVPFVDASKNALLNRLIGWIPGAGSVTRTVAGTVIGSAVMIKNTMGVSVILFLLFVLVVPVIKLLLYSLCYLLLSIVLEPVAEERFLRCMTAAQKSGWLMVCALCMTAALFILSIAVTAMATNHI